MEIIKSYKVFESAESVESICKKYGIKNWTLNSDGSIDVDGDVDLYNIGLNELPLKFGKVTGNFDCSCNNLTLVGSPNWVGGYFSCSSNNLTSLEGSPNWVGGDFDCSWNKLTSLEGGPNFVGGGFFDCSRNNLTSLEGCPEKIYGDLGCQMNKIITLDYYPTILTGRLWTEGNPIYEIWDKVFMNKSKNHGLYLHLFQLHDPIRFEGGEWVCHVEFLDSFFNEIGIHRLKNYKEV